MSDRHERGMHAREQTGPTLGYFSIKSFAMSICSSVSLQENDERMWTKWDESLLPNTPGSIQKLFASIFGFGATDICRPSSCSMTMIGRTGLKNAHQKNPPTFPFLKRGISICPGIREPRSIAETLLANTERASMGKSIAETCEMTDRVDV